MLPDFKNNTRLPERLEALPLGRHFIRADRQQGYRVVSRFVADGRPLDAGQYIPRRHRYTGH